MSLATILASGSFGLGAISSLAQYQEGQYEHIAAIRQSEALQLQSQYAQQTAGIEIAAQDYKATHILSRIQAVAGASGIQNTEGSTAQVLESSAEEARINDMYTKYAANVQSSQLQYEANLIKAQGEESAGIATFGAFGGGITSGIQAYGLSGLPGSQEFAKFNGPTLRDLLLAGGGTF